MTTFRWTAIAISLIGIAWQRTLLIGTGICLLLLLLLIRKQHDAALAHLERLRKSAPVDMPSPRASQDRSMTAEAGTIAGAVKQADSVEKFNGAGMPVP